VLVYLKGGAAVTDNTYSSFFNAPNAFAPPGTTFNAASDTRWGGAVGGGIEVGFAPNWSVGVEYDHLFMGNPNVTFPATTIAVTRNDNIGQDVDMGTVRVNYRFFGSPIVAGY
jgi:outer membrane immunogenic protein